MSKRKFARYVVVGTRNCRELVDVARSNGMQIITAYKPDMHVCHEIGLYGTPEQMAQTDTEWESGGNKIERRPRRSLVFGVHLQRPRSEWVERQFESGALV